MYKESFRMLSKRLLTHIPPEKKTEAVKLIKDQLIKSNWWKSSNIIALTIPRKIELNTIPIIEEAWKQGKTVVIPKCFPEDNYLMKFYRYTNSLELENVYLDLYEPKDDKHKLVDKKDIDLLIVPGLLYDYKGYRIGYGGGYYDRYLVDFKNVKISIALEEQLVKHLPYDPYDIPVDAIITNRNIYKT
ncbi:5-formyltetrahydrofolate cyclo-ligase [Bacillaceae bacterium W0354]